MARTVRRALLAATAVVFMLFPVRGCALRMTARGAPDIDARLQVGVRYKYDLHTHCGIDVIQIDDSTFRARRPVDDPVPFWWGVPGWTDHPGSIMLTSPDDAVFVGNNGLTKNFYRVYVPPGSFVGCK